MLSFNRVFGDDDNEDEFVIDNALSFAFLLREG
jgi:hypothetical protein